MFDDFEDDLVDEADLPEPQASGLLPPRQMSDCFGHEAIEKALIELTDADRLPHALIFAGPQGIGKSTFAFRLARYLLKKGTGGDTADGGLFGDVLPKEKTASLLVAADDPVFHQVASGGHPDLLTIERLFDEKNGKLKGTVEVEEVRRITPFMRMTASQGGWRVVIVDDADTMNRSSQNAILKILEEPPPNALLILVCHRLGSMLPTIRSRSRVIHFQTPDQTVFSKVIGQDHGNLSDSDQKLLHSISGGSPGQGIHIASEGGLEAIGKIMVLFHGWPKWQWLQIHMLAEAMGRAGQEDSLKAFQEVMIWIVNSVLRAKARGEALRPPLNNEALQRLMDHYTLPQWIEISGQLREHFDTVSFAALDKRHAVLGAFSVFDEAA